MEKFWQDKCVFVTGGTGFIGSWLTRRLVDLGAKVSLLFYDAPTPSEIIRSRYVDRVNVVYGQLQEYDVLEKTLYEHQIDTVFHLGAQTQVKEALLHPFATYESNIRGTYSLLEACRRHRHLLKRIIVASSDKAYGIHEHLPYVETTPLRATYPYDVSKACTDLIALSYYHTYQLPVVVARCGNIYGGGDFNWNRLIPSVIRSFYHHQSPILRSDGYALRDYVFIEDIIQAYLILGEQMETSRLPGEVFNFSTSQPAHVLRIVELLAKLMHAEHLHPIIENSVQAEIPHQYLSAQKAWEKLGWQPYVSLKVGLSMTLDWYLQFFKEENIRGVKQQVTASCGQNT